MLHSTLLTLLLVTSLNGQTSEVYQIVTNSTDQCTSYPCYKYTLSQFATRISESNHRHRPENISLIFKPGIHSLTVDLSLSNLYSFSMSKGNLLTTAHIECASTAHILLSSIDYVHIKNLKLFGCEGNQVVSVQQFVLHDSTFEGREYGGSALQLYHTTAQIVNVHFVWNTGVHILFDSMPISFGGAIFVQESHVSLTQTKFEQNYADVGGAIVANNSIIYANNCTMIGNRAFWGGSVLASNSTLLVEECEFDSNQALEYGGAVGCQSSIISIKKTNFYNSISTVGGGVFGSFDCKFDIKTSDFLASFATSGVVVYSQMSIITIRCSDFQNNIATTDGGIAQSDSSTIVIRQCTFQNNFVDQLGGVLLSPITESSFYLNDIRIYDSNFSNTSLIG